ncbi:MAG: selenium metabolism-associated LysR family transcriptional regulator [Syntrophomonadaceae bacterium]|nr:selenium metabolism-associated LysR family transcriptional regulator [Syntrophomonadaceae bacterium]MDH7496932.1 selenium metabolism-associated LysR family transcriptional regulator [Syntrophomonadaceae bacterium]
MNLRQLTTFVKIVEKGSVSAAARELFMTQSAASKHLQALEEACGAALLQRVGNRMVLTDAGEIFYRYAREMVSLGQQLEAAMNLSAPEVRGHLRMGASTVPGNYIMPSLLGRLVKEYPEVRVTLEVRDTQETVNRMLDNQLDVGVIGAPARNPRLESRPFAHDRLVLVVPSAHQWAARTSVTLAEALGEKLVWREKGSGTRTMLEKRLHEAGIDSRTLRVVLEVGSTEATIAAVEEGLGLALVSLWAAAKAAQGGRVRWLEVEDVDLARDLYLVWLKARGSSLLLQAFLQVHQAWSQALRAPGTDLAARR